MKQKITLLFVVLCAALGVQAQRATSLRLNEVLVINEDNFMDDYGKKHSWIEIYNSSAGTVNIAGCFLTNDLNNPRMYPIPKGDILTKIKPRQHVLFWADGNPTHGTFHLNFTLDPEKPNFLALFDSNGTTLIDSITVPVGQKADISYGLKEDGVSADGWQNFTKVTPSSNNRILDKNEKVERFQEQDADGIGMTMTAMGVVFVGLILLFLIFRTIGNVAVWLTHRRVMQASGVSMEQAKGISEQSGDVYAAIAMAIYEATECHDEEHTILTIKNTARTYSPWSSKIYSLRETPIKK